MLLRTLLLFGTVLASQLSLALSQGEVIAGAAHIYHKQLTEIDQRGGLDLDADFLMRVKRIAASLIVQAKREFPETMDWTWEIHISSDEEETAFCMAGGKLLLGQAHAVKLSLNDAELAMLLSHEIEHALQQHNLKEYAEALRLFPVWQQQPFSALEVAVDNDTGLMHALARFNFDQEIEADREGLMLAWRAGWPASRLANYFKKLSRASHSANFDSASHPAPARRWQAARALAQDLEAPN